MLLCNGDTLILWSCDYHLDDLYHMCWVYILWSCDYRWQSGLEPTS